MLSPLKNICALIQGGFVSVRHSLRYSYPLLRPPHLPLFTSRLPTSPPASDASSGGATPLAIAVHHAPDHPGPDTPSSSHHPRPPAAASSSPVHSRPPSSSRSASYEATAASPRAGRTKTNCRLDPPASRHCLHRGFVVYLPRLYPLREVRCSFSTLTATHSEQGCV